MSAIICAIRGGPHSRETITRAINLAKETDLPLHFLYIVNLDFLSHTASSRIHAISKDMHQMGEFILLSAQASAEAAGVGASGIVRQGSVMEEITNLCHELNARYLVLGHPQSENNDTVFTTDMLREFCIRTEEQTGAEIILTGGE